MCFLGEKRCRRVHAQRWAGVYTATAVTSSRTFLRRRGRHAERSKAKRNNELIVIIGQHRRDHDHHDLMIAPCSRSTLTKIPNFNALDVGVETGNWQKNPRTPVSK